MTRHRTEGRADQGRKPRDAPPAARRLSPPGHTVHELAPGLLLVYKPRGHREGTHAHPHAQRLRVLRGRLEVRTARGVVRVAAGDRPLRIAAERAHSTCALADTWLLAERLR
jgi:hypothetical protein